METLVYRRPVRQAEERMMEESKEAYLERTKNQWNEKSDSWYPILRTDEIIAESSKT